MFDVFVDDYVRLMLRKIKEKYKTCSNDHENPFMSTSCKHTPTASVLPLMLHYSTIIILTKY